MALNADTLDLVGVQVTLYRAGLPLYGLQHRLDTRYKGMWYVDGQAWQQPITNVYNAVSKGKPVIVNASQPFAVNGDWKRDDAYLLNYDIARIELRSIGDWHAEPPDWSGMDHLLQHCSVDEVLDDTVEVLLAEGRRRLDERDPQCFGEPIVSFVTLWNYIAETHYDPEGESDQSEYWEYLGVVDTTRAKNILMEQKT